MLLRQDRFGGSLLRPSSFALSLVQLWISEDGNPMEDEEGGETPAGNPDSKPFATTRRTPLPAQGVSEQLATDVHWVTHATFWSQIGLGLIGIVALVITTANCGK